MGKGCRSASHQLFKDKAKNRVDDLQGMFSDLQSARKESRTADVAVLEEQVHQMLREWRAELNEPSPANSLLGNTHVSSDLPSETLRLLQLSEEEDDATSKLAEQAPGNPKPEPLEVPGTNARSTQGGGAAVCQGFLSEESSARRDPRFSLTATHQSYCSFPEETYFWSLASVDDYASPDYYVNEEQHGFIYANQYKSNLPMESHHNAINCVEGTTDFDYQQYNNLNQEMPHDLYADINTTEQNGGDLFPHMSDLLPTICPPPSAFLRPKCALWDCPRPAQGSEWCEDYCSSFHATLAFNEGPPGMTPVLRPGGIDLKDGPLFAALNAKTQGKNVGIPVCEGAATAKSPWNAPELFDLSVLEGESIREWLFFDKPRRAFESGNRKQRSLPDYSGRGWHESRKQVMKEFGGLKRSYYMDPQPLSHFEWHLYEYEINNCDAFALYRLEFKLVDGKRSAKSRLTSNTVVDLQQQMGRLNAENSVDNKKNVKSRMKGSRKEIAEIVYSTPDIANQKESASVFHASDQMPTLNENSSYGHNLQYAYSLESLNDYYGT